MTGHLGYERHDQAGAGRGNIRNGTTIERNWSTFTPCFAIFEALRSMSSRVWLMPGDRVEVVLIYSANRLAKRWDSSVVSRRY